MTYKEYIGRTLDRFNVSDDEVDLIIIDNSFNDEVVDVEKAKKAIHKSLGAWLPVYSSVSEGGVTKAYNLDALKLYYSNLCKELGVVDTTKPTIRDRSNIW